jgi:hypothetical protein
MNYQPFSGRMVGAWGGRGAALGAGTLTESTFLSAQLTQSTRLLVEMADAESLRLGLAIRRVEEADRSLPAAVAYAFLPGCDPDLNTLAALAAPDLPDLLLPQLPGDLFPAVLMSHPSGALALTVPGLITDPDFAAALLDRLTAVVMALESLKVEEQVVVEASL